MNLLFVGDGPRDCATIPPLVMNILGSPVVPKCLAWKEIELLQGGSGYDRKLTFSLAKARTEGHDGVVATVDRDTEPPRLRLSILQKARERDREKPINLLPTAIGEANRNGDAWPLDDPKAVRDVLQLSVEIEIPNVRDGDPKIALKKLIGTNARTESAIDLLREISASIDISRCNHSDETGLDEFVNDVQTELGPLAAE